MKRSKRSTLLTLAPAALLLLTLAGCGGKPKNDPMAHPTREQLRGRIVQRPKEPPKPPARKDVPLDPALVSAARQELAEAAASKDATLRANALESMRDVPGPESHQAILHGLEDQEPVVRFAAAMAAGELQLQEAREPLLGMVDDPAAHVRVAVRFALHKLGIYDYSHDLEDSARSTDPGVRGNTALALGLLGEPSGLKILRILAKDAHPAVRQQTYESMWRLGDRTAVDDLVAMTVSLYADDQMVGLLALAAPREPTVKQHIRQALTSDYPEVALVAARAMGMLGSDEGYAIAEKRVKAGDARQRFLAALAFGAIGRTDAQPFLKTLLKDRDARVRVAAAASILQLGPRDPAGVAGAAGSRGS